MQGVAARPPAFIVVSTDRRLPWYVAQPRVELDGFPEFLDFFQQHYEFDVAIGRFEVFRRVEQS